MASVVIGNPLASGPQQVILGDFYSGTRFPIGGIQLRWDANASGNLYVGLNSGMTVNSGGMFLSGGANSGRHDGMQIRPGDPYFIAKCDLPVSGTFNIFAVPDATASGNRLYFQAF